MVAKLIVSSSSRFLPFARALSTRPAFSLLTNVAYHTFLGKSAVNSAVQQQQRNYTANYTRNLPSIVCKDLNKKSHQDFSFNLAKRCLVDGLNSTSQKNLLCSPVSTSAIINMLVPGSKGETLYQFLDLLGLEEEKLNKSAMRLIDAVKPLNNVAGAPQIAFSNSVWLDQQYQLTQSYKELIKNVHNADVKSVDFLYQADDVMQEVNRWSRRKTEGMIKSILPETSYYNDTVMVLANALHFKLGSSDETVDSNEALMYYCGCFDGSEVLRMPYKQSNTTVVDQDPRSFSMYVLVPSNPSGENDDPRWGFKPIKQKKSLQEIIEEMKVDGKTAFEKQIKRQMVEISDILVPKFNLENLLYVTDITQKSRIECNKGGLSFSVVTYTTLCGPQHRFPTSSKLKFVAENPFMFMIQEDISGAVVSVGTMLSTPLSKF
ncbi:serpin-Z2B isoform X2 [Beta vulgaris subsp. vulgaris]|uniref:serpin-Z2B isoform X2 n=1 Tax=Beta vulgaris subsp. vulgaris TaxID=3555 RepID=UPI00203748C4|nr:serpin-Z2B isoform X2 [Beta vulgaris subsp. vulgaris]